MIETGKPIDLVKMAKARPMVSKVANLDPGAHKVLTSYMGTLDGIGCRDDSGRWMFTGPEDAMQAAKATQARIRQRLGMAEVSE